MDGNECSMVKTKNNNKMKTRIPIITTRLCILPVLLVLLQFEAAQSQPGSCFDPFILNLNEQWTKVGSINTIDKVWFEFTAPADGMLEYCPVNGQMSVEILSSCDPLDILQWTDTGIECAPSTPFCPDPQNLFIYRTTPNEKILIGIQGTEDPFTCVGPIEIRYVASGNTCADPTPITCGETVRFTTDLLTNMINWLDCGGPSFPATGQDKTFLLDMTSTSDITIDMSSLKGDRDRLGVYRICNDCLAGCFFTGCEELTIQPGNESITIFAASGQYLIVCDWEPTDQADLDDGNEFQLSISCSPCIANDIVDPIVSCPVSELVAVAPDGQNCAEVYYPIANASDDCELDNVTYSTASGSCFPLGITVVTVTATDASGNSSSCTFSVVVEEYVCCLDITLEGNNLFNTAPEVNPVYMDVDNDGDVDWLISASEYYENVSGVGVDPNFDKSSGPKTISYNNPFTSLVYYNYDYNMDGDEDIFALDQNMNLLYCVNDGLSGTASFTVINTGLAMPFNGADFSSYSISIGDLGNDGLPDIVVGFVGAQNTLSVVYYEHISGTNCASQLCFQLAGNSYSSPFISGALNATEIPIVEIYDGNCDGNEDLYVGLLGEVRLFRNMGGITSQGNTPPLDIQNPITNPHGISNLEITGEEFTTPRFVDADSDGDTELFISELNNKVSYFENCGDMVTSTTNEVSVHSGITVFPNPTNNGITVLLMDKDALFDHVQVYNLHGSPVYSSKQDGRYGSMEIDCSFLVAGVYLLKAIDSKRNTYLEKLIILK